MSIEHARSAFDSLRDDAAPRVRAAIWRVFSTCLDLGVSESDCEDAEQKTWLWAHLHLDSLLDPNATATPSSRLYAVAMNEARAIKTARLRTKKRFADVNLHRIGIWTDEKLERKTAIEPMNELEKDENFVAESSS